MAEAAIDHIYNMYRWGQSVTNIINRTQRNCEDGGHASWFACLDLTVI